MKPGTKNESHWKMLRHDWSKNASKNGFTTWAKRMISKARRRESNQIIEEEKDI